MTREPLLLADDDVMCGHVTPGDVLEGKYRIDELLSQGGMSSVFLGEHLGIRRRVVLKLVHATSATAEACRRRFENEARAAARVASDRVVEILDVGATAAGEPFIVMERLQGETLKARLEASTPMTPAQILPIARQLLEGLSDCHAAGVLHLDLKPGNVFLERVARGAGDRVKILDFGIARVAGSPAEPEDASVVIGTAHYMSPEQAVGNEVDARSDVYSVGVTLYRAVTGQAPFSGTPLDRVLYRVVFERPPHPKALRPDLDDAFGALVLRAMARDPDDRFASADALLAALDAWERGEGERVTMPDSIPPKPATKNDSVPATAWGSTSSLPAAGARVDGPSRRPARSRVAFTLAASALTSAIVALGIGADRAPASAASSPEIVAWIAPLAALAAAPRDREPPAIAPPPAPAPARAPAPRAKPIAATPAMTAAAAPRVVTPVAPAKAAATGASAAIEASQRDGVSSSPARNRIVIEDYGY